MSAVIQAGAVAPMAMRWPVLDAGGGVRAFRADGPALATPAAILDLLRADHDPGYERAPLLLDARFEDVSAWLEGRSDPAGLASRVLPVLAPWEGRCPSEPAQAWVWAGRRFALRVEVGLPAPATQWLAPASFVLVSCAPERRATLPALLATLRAETGAEIVADRVYAPAQVREAQALGFDAWVGPAWQPGGGLTPARISAVRLLTLLIDPRTEPLRVVDAINTDASLTASLLAWLGRAEMHGYEEVDVAAAVRLLGFDRLQAWAGALAIAGEPQAPVDALERALVRAALCAELARLDARLVCDPRWAWLVGLLAELPLLTGQPMPQAVAAIGLSGGLRAGLLDDDTPLGRLRCLVSAYECGDWQRVRASGYGPALADAYLGAVLAAGATLAQWRAGPADAGRRP